MRVIEITHPVKDFAAWKIGYDLHEETRQKYGLNEVELLTDPADHNLVTVVFEEAVPGGFDMFMEEADLKNVMYEYGVIGEPYIQYFEKELV